MALTESRRHREDQSVDTLYVQVSQESDASEVPSLPSDKLAIENIEGE